MDIKAEKITPYGSNATKTDQVKDMFDSIAPAYDFMNRAMTFGIDKIWRKIAVNILNKEKPKILLDVATGTGDLAFMLHKVINPDQIIGIDLSSQMLSIAETKAKKAGLENTIKFEQGNCLDLKYKDNSFDTITVAYGVRNFEDLRKGYSEMHRVLNANGTLCVIELSTPPNPFIKWIYDIYTKYLIPFVGKLISKDKRAYTYLPESIAAVPQGNDMLEIMKEAGFKNCFFKRLTFGVCTIYIGKK